MKILDVVRNIHGGATGLSFQYLNYNNLVIRIASNFHSLAAFIKKSYVGWNMLSESSSGSPSIQIKAVCDKVLNQRITSQLHDLKKTGEGYFLGVLCAKYHYSDLLIIHSFHRDLLYIFDQKHQNLLIVGNDTWVISLSVSSCANLFFSSQLLQAGFIIAHAASFIFRNQGFLVLGGKGAGKTSTVLSIIDEKNKFVSNDKCYLKIVGGELICRTLQQDIPLGLGFIKSMGWDKTIREGLALGEIQHPGTKTHIHDMIRRNNFTPRFRESGREYKYFLFTSQIPNLVATTRAGIQVILRPHVCSDNQTMIRPTLKKTLVSKDFSFTPIDEVFLELLPVKAISSYLHRIKKIELMIEKIPSFDLFLDYDINANKKKILDYFSN
jgi:hypothetical protein